MAHTPVGSQWGRWDLHFHTPASFDYAYKAASAKEIVESLVAEGIVAVAVTDHHLVDPARILEIREQAAGRLTVFPGIELRSELGSKPIHYIGIFSELIDLTDLWDTLRIKLGLTPEGVASKGGDTGVYVPIHKAAPIIRDELGGLISIHAGGKSNSIEGIRSTEEFQRRIKFDVSHEFVDIFEVGQVKDVLDYRDIVFPDTGLDLPIIVASDCHDIRSYDPAPSCWLKAEPTFFGLRQVLNEPRDRVWLGTEPPRIAHVRDHKSHYMKRIEIAKTGEEPKGQKWFDGTALELNHGLIAVIGNQGSGKSALSDIVGHVGNCPHQESFSFLHPDQFRLPRDNKAEGFVGAIVWENGAKTTANLAARVPESAPELVRYIPQYHLDAICDELKGGRAGMFDRELKKVIFSRVPPADQLGEPDLQALLTRLTSDTERRIDTLMEELRSAARALGRLESRREPEYRENLASQIKVQEAHLAALESEEPAPVVEPAADPATEEQQAKVRAQLQELADERDSLTEEVATLQSELATVAQREQSAVSLRAQLESLRAQVDRTLEAVEPVAGDLGLGEHDFVTITWDLGPLDALQAALTERRTAVEALLDEDAKGSLPARLADLRDRRAALQEQLDEPGRQYQAYVTELESWQEKKARVLGAPDQPDTLEYLRAHLRSLADLPSAITAEKARIFDIALRIFDEKAEILDVYDRLYGPVQEFIDTHPIARERFGLQFTTSLSSGAFVARFLDHIDQGRRGNFHGLSEGYDHAQQIIAKADLGSRDGLKAFLDTVWTALHEIDGDSGEKDLHVGHQLRRDFTSEDLFEFIFGLEYLEPRYLLSWEGRPLEQLSPGQRGTLLLIFFLLIDEGRIPLVIDQPEGNLDNQTVFELLVDCIKEAKERRQIVIVTHNPNLAVVCDAEQVVHATLDKADGYRVSYTSGALENPQMCEHIVNVLEGTKPAIDKRMSKYRVIFGE